MGTDKRERQKQNRQLKLEEMAKEARKRKTKRRGLQIGIGIPLAIAVVFGLVFLFGDDDETTPTVSDSPTSVADPTATTTVDLGSVSSIDPIGTGAAPLPCPEPDGSSEKVESFPAEPEMCIDEAKTYTVEVETNKGSYTAVLDAAKAPITVNSFVYLARYHYFDDTPCHRIITDFVVQCGDPTGSGTGGPGYEFVDELPSAGEYEVGSLAMANSGPNTNGSQFFVVTGDQGVALPPQYTLFGKVTAGMDTVETLNGLAQEDSTPSEPVTITKVTVTES